MQIPLKGGAELQAFLQQLPAKIEKNVMRGALRAGAKVIQQAVREKAPIHRGILRESIKLKTSSRNGVVSARIVIGDKKSFYAHFVEFGTKAHTITAKKGGLIFFNGVFRESIDHPGARAEPFARPAMDESQGQALLAATQYIKKRLTQKHGFDIPDIEDSDES